MWPLLEARLQLVVLLSFFKFIVQSVVNLISIFIHFFVSMVLHSVSCSNALL